MFKDLRTSTEFFLLWAVFAGAIILATYSLIEEKQIAIGFVRKELAGTQYLDALRGVYTALLVPTHRKEHNRRLLLEAGFGGACQN